jgi:Lysyl oxidase
VRTALAVAVAAAATTAGVANAQAPPVNPCLGPEAAQLRCPDLTMRRPFGLYVDRYTKPGRTLLRAGNAIDSIGAGPAELHGVRISPHWMRAWQRIYRQDGRRIHVNTGARLQFKFAHLARYWWKFYNAASFQLWRVDASGRRTVRVRTGPKVAYCLRDLRHTRPWLRRSPRRARYPACSTNPFARQNTLGTSVGWADVYPPTYPEQWINVTGLRGCFAYVHIADPNNRIFESNEENNEAQVIVRLPFNRTARRAGCKGADRGLTMGGGEYY